MNKIEITNDYYTDIAAARKEGLVPEKGRPVSKNALLTIIHGYNAEVAAAEAAQPKATTTAPKLVNAAACKKLAAGWKAGTGTKKAKAAPDRTSRLTRLDEQLKRTKDMADAVGSGTKRAEVAATFGTSVGRLNKHLAAQRLFDQYADIAQAVKDLKITFSTCLECAVRRDGLTQLQGMLKDA
jgi:hypothetical protein